MLDTGKTPEQLLAEAEAALKDVREQMAKLAAPKTVKAGAGRDREQHATPAMYMAAGQEGLEEATAFVREKGLVTLPAQRESAGDRDAGVHARHLRWRVQCGAGAGAAAGRVLLDHAHSEGLAQGAHRIEAARIQPLRPDGDDHSRGHARPLRADSNTPTTWSPSRGACCAASIGNAPYVEGWAFYTQQMMSDEGLHEQQQGTAADAS